ncbi:protein LTO1 homolog isoform X3 [Bos indicus x Bos taurus]|uniref:protein LTO1 homolog isoform X3 n=1 Tax=Bos taurus TaxID=9913 RepID=UPI000383DD57|nr:protein LTO1 homolog isoform X3 [Bos taurus]XP_027388722.1 protein LTO1 homolog isoform X3 [Bos indicus x Bos taurus]
MAGDQDMFDAVVMADERFHGEGYREGYEEGSSLGMIEGRQHGTLHGAKIGSEIGCYQGFAFAWRGLLHSCATERDRKSRCMEILEGVRLIPRSKCAPFPWSGMDSVPGKLELQFVGGGPVLRGQLHPLWV